MYSSFYLIYILGKPFVNFFMCFSLIQNMKTILTTDVGRGVIGVINGVRVFSISWIIIGHLLFYAPLYSPVGK